ncbi:MAG: aminotransferase class I/II-fold pyridoxal phosphate-dependent enzyme, partial [Planctomycetes bacterium]|nr:aminotransferase class I/II-fold pyridoxal phosphate-dependent enzyme [Planctomycetota bacterium]
YPVYEAGTLYANGQCHAVPLQADSNYQLELKTIEPTLLKQCRIAWINYPHNPTGACVDLPYLQRQKDICQEYDILLVADECYADMWFNHCSTPPPSLLQCGIDDILVVHSCSKRSGMTGYRSGFIAGDPQLITHYKKCRAAMGVASPHFIQAAANAAWKDDQHVDKRRQCFSTKRSLLITGLSNKGIDICPSDAGLYIWAKVPSGFNAQDYAQLCLDHGIVISPGGFFGPGNDSFFRIALVPSLDDCAQALSIWPT